MILIEHFKIGIVIYCSLAQDSNGGDFGEADVLSCGYSMGPGWEKKQG